MLDTEYRKGIARGSMVLQLVSLNVLAVQILQIQRAFISEALWHLVHGCSLGVTSSLTAELLCLSSSG